MGMDMNRGDIVIKGTCDGDQEDMSQLKPLTKWQRHGMVWMKKEELANRHKEHMAYGQYVFTSSQANVYHPQSFFRR